MFAQIERLGERFGETGVQVAASRTPRCERFEKTALTERIAGFRPVPRRDERAAATACCR
ncbi:hypothetical protein [Aromatoleum bremense]|uniref:Uncharacterized protein n=1 Tax=Aromatoleum bremense TaxID=76115 RepID=A0ABX1NX60_9RHOO|nr:hypothetical protein [Aromatoleum bremense]NMG16615.1 hypothetical protein [Aromatoleum bremense]